MDMDQAAVFLAGSILTVMGFLIILGGVLIANNLIAKYWISWGWTFYPTWANEQTARFLTEEEVAKAEKQSKAKSKTNDANTKDM